MGLPGWMMNSFVVGGCRRDLLWSRRPKQRMRGWARLGCREVTGTRPMDGFINLWKNGMKSQMVSDGMYGLFCECRWERKSSPRGKGSRRLDRSLVVNLVPDGCLDLPRHSRLNSSLLFLHDLWLLELLDTKNCSICIVYT